MRSVSDDCISERILFFARPRRQKVARIFGQVMTECEEKEIAVKAATLDRCLRSLVEAGRLEAFGNIAKWRFSEVRLPEGVSDPSASPA